MLKKIIDFIRHGVWQQRESDIRNPKVRWFLRPFKIILYTVKGVGEHHVVQRSAAMTFYTLMTIVPIAALIFSIVKGFGLETNLNEYLYSKFPQYSAVIDNILSFANNLLERTRSGVIASVGFVVLLWAVMRLFGNLEKAMNDIWEIKKRRSLTRKFSGYVTVVFITPLLLAISNSLIIYLRSSVAKYTTTWLTEILFGFLSLAAIWLLFTFIYYVLPNTRVKFKGALTAGIAAGTVFQIYQIAYFYIQSGVTSYNAIYGSFAALPLFLIWLQASWQILLFGAELSFAYQNISQYEQEREALHMNADHRRKVLVATMAVITKHFIRRQGPVSSEEVADELSLPVRIVRDVIFDLDNAELVAPVKSELDEKINLYIPAVDVHELKLMDIVDGVEKCGSSFISVDDNKEMQKVCKTIDELKMEAASSSFNVCITELIEDF